LACAGLVILFVFQHFDFGYFLFRVRHTLADFLINRSIRFFLNDLFAIALIYALFKERKYVLFAIYTQVFGFFFLLIPYFILKINWPSYNGPMINFLHRIILNPTLLLLLIPSFYYQKTREV
jgi:exosortase F-associated protein